MKIKHLDPQNRPYKRSTQSRTDLIAGHASSRRSMVAPDWHALYAPAGVPGPVLEKLRAAALFALQLPALREKMLQQGAEPTDPSPALLEKHIRKDYVRWSKLVAEAKIQVD